jgi:hypothetical protein
MPIPLVIALVLLATALCGGIFGFVLGAVWAEPGPMERVDARARLRSPIPSAPPTITLSAETAADLVNEYRRQTERPFASML